MCFNLTCYQFLCGNLRDGFFNSGLSMWIGFFVPQFYMTALTSNCTQHDDISPFLKWPPGNRDPDQTRSATWQNTKIRFLWKKFFSLHFEVPGLTYCKGRIYSRAVWYITSMAVAIIWKNNPHISFFDLLIKWHFLPRLPSLQAMFPSCHPFFNGSG
jgi:hypothetical protein